jgi:hypothetical protein
MPLLTVITTAPLTEANLKSLVQDMLTDPGYIPAGQLHDWYAGMCREVNATPISKKAFGTALKDHGLVSYTRRIGGNNVRCWLITRKWLRP